MVIPFPAAAAAPPPIGVLLARCIGFLEGLEGDPKQPQVQHLLHGLRHAQADELIALPAPAYSAYHFYDWTDLATSRCDSGAGYMLSRHDPFHDESIGRWYWSAARCDDEGRLWRTRGVAVIDDFGNLVEVPA